MAPPFPAHLAPLIPLFADAKELMRILTCRHGLTTDAHAQRKRLLDKLGPDGRAWMLQTIDESLTEEREPVMFGLTKATLFQEMGTDRCVLCKCAVFAMDLDATGNFCSVCVQDLVFLGHNINEVAKILRRGEWKP